MILDLLAHLLRAVAFVLALAAAAPAALAWGGVVSDRLDVLTHFAPFYLAGGVLALALHYATRPERGGLTLVLGTVAVLAAGALMTPELIAAIRAKTTPPGARTLTLLQFNLWGRNQDPQGTARWILAQDADVVVLEEAFDEAMVVPKALARRYPHRTTCAEPLLCSTMILSKAAPSAKGGLEAKGIAARLSGAWATYGEGPDAFTVVGVHYTWPVPAGAWQSQSRRLATVLDGFDRSSLVLAGDFNSTPWSFSLRRQDARFGLVRRTRALFSWPAAAFSHRRIRSPLPFLPIDHVYAGSAWRTVEVRRGPRLASDHFPVLVRLTRDAPR